MKNQIILLVIYILLMCGCAKSFEKTEEKFIKRGIVQEIQYVREGGLFESTVSVIIFTDGYRMKSNGIKTFPTGVLLDVYWVGVWWYSGPKDDDPYLDKSSYKYSIVPKEETK